MADLTISRGDAGQALSGLCIVSGELVVTGLGDPAPSADLTRTARRPSGRAEETGLRISVDQIAAVEQLAMLAVAADSLGASESLFDHALDYVRERVQFGVPVGSFQAVQHLCAEAYVRLEALRSGLSYAAWAHTTGGSDSTHAAWVAKSYANWASVAVVNAATQVFGGIAITWEHDAHRTLRRVVTNRLVFGDDNDLLRDSHGGRSPDVEFGSSDELNRFRDELRSWLRENTIEPDEAEPQAAFLQRWHQLLFTGGWVGLSWPVEVGGRGLTPSHEAILNEEIGAVGAPDAPRIGYLGRAILEYGSQAQRDRLIPGLLSGGDYWCQGFSEPEAGSDLANLATRAVRIDDGYLINGQKVWTSYADYADYCLLLARTGERAERHRGVSAFILPMDAGGVEVRPLRANTGEDEFCEIFLNDVAVEDGALLGNEGDGWPIAMMTVAYERGAADVGYLSKFGASVRELRRHVQARALVDSSVQQLLGELEMHFSILSFHVRRRMRERELAPGLPGPEMSVDKILMTTIDQAIYDTAVRLLGPSVIFDLDDEEWMKRYLYSRGASIYGGSQQIQLNILAQRCPRAAALSIPPPRRPTQRRSNNCECRLRSRCESPAST